MMKLFGTSGIRGLITGKLKPEHCVKLGLSLATLLDNEGTVVIGYDHRPQAISVKNALISGLVAGGVNVIDVGIAPTPAVLYFAKRISPEAIIVVTGSHTIPEIIGVLFFNKDTSEFSPDIEMRLEEIYFSERFRRVPWNRLGSVSEEDVIPVYKEAVISLIDESKVSGRKVVIDPGNGVSSHILGDIFRSVSIDVVSINDHMDPLFRGRDPFPRVDNLGDLGKLVKCVNADLGVGVDGDGDRALFSDELGNVHWGDISGAIFAEDAVKRGSRKVVVTINTSHVVSFAIKKAGGEVIFSKVGPPAIADMMKKHGALFGIEESGKYLWADAIYYGDAALATLRLLEIMNDNGKTFSELANELPKYHMLKVAIPCSDKIKRIVLEKSSEIIEDKLREDIINVVRIDGVKIMLRDDSWILLRPSGTEPVFRVFAESRDIEKTKRLIEIGETVVRGLVSRFS